MFDEYSDMILPIFIKFISKQIIWVHSFSFQVLEQYASTIPPSGFLLITFDILAQFKWNFVTFPKNLYGKRSWKYKSSSSLVV